MIMAKIPYIEKWLDNQKDQLFKTIKETKAAYFGFSYYDQKSNDPCSMHLFNCEKNEVATILLLNSMPLHITVTPILHTPPRSWGISIPPLKPFLESHETV